MVGSAPGKQSKPDLYRVNPNYRIYIYDENKSLNATKCPLTPTLMFPQRTSAVSSTAFTLVIERQMLDIKITHKIRGLKSLSCCSFMDWVIGGEQRHV